MRTAHPPTLSFLGGAGTVTGSKHLVTSGRERVLLDCGMFQGLKDLRVRNWAEPPFDVGSLDAVVLSHAHLDHCGALPVLVRRGFRGPIHCTAATADLVEIVLADAARIQEEDAERANRHHTSKHTPALPLYTAHDVSRTVALLERHRFGKPVRVSHSMSATFARTGHILGAASVQLELASPSLSVVFSGDLGRWGRPILRDPELVEDADVVLIESTYGDRLHQHDAAAQLARVVCETAQRGGVIIVPAFAIGRTQELMWTLRKLEDEGRVPTLPVFVDSPMANSVTELYCRHTEEPDLDMATLMNAHRNPLFSRNFTSIQSSQESKALNSREGPMIIIASSGMATGGRVVQHLKLRLGDERNTVLLSGYQAAGTRGRALQEGATELLIEGRRVTVRAHVERIDGLSAHADQGELLRWARGFKKAPRMAYVVHGEPASAATLAQCLRDQLQWPVTVAVDQATVELVSA